MYVCMCVSDPTMAQFCLELQAILTKPELIQWELLSKSIVLQYLYYFFLSLAHALYMPGQTKAMKLSLIHI